MAEDAPPKKSSMVGTIVGVLIATVLAVVCGGGGGLYMAKMFDKAEEVASDTGQTGKPEKPGKKTKNIENASKTKGKKKSGKSEAKDEAADTDEDGVPKASKQRIVLAPITTNLLKPSGTWIRLEASVMPTKALAEDQSELVVQMQEDLLGFLRTLKLSQIQGPSGFQHMREDLNDRIRIRSRGAFDKLLIHALLVE